MLARYGLMFVTVLVLLFVHADRSRARFEWVVKPAAAAIFVVAGVYSGALSTRWGTVLFVGLCLAAAGDVLLIPKNKRAFLAGLISFLLGHVAYAIAFFLRGFDLVWAGVALAACAAVGGWVLRWLWPHVEREMRGPVAAYFVVITSMVTLAAGTVGARGDAWILVGAIGFYLSDLAVAKERFVGSKFVNRAWGLPLYFFSQLILAGTAA